MQTKQLHVRLTQDEMDALKGVADQCEVSPSALAGFFMRAALRAVKAYGQRLKLPPNFEVKEEPLAFSRSGRVKTAKER